MDLHRLVLETSRIVLGGVDLVSPKRRFQRNLEGQEEAGVVTSPPVMADGKLEQTAVREPEGLTFATALAVPVIVEHADDLVLVQDGLGLV